MSLETRWAEIRCARHVNNRTLKVPPRWSLHDNQPIGVGHLSVLRSACIHVQYNTKVNIVIGYVLHASLHGSTIPRTRRQRSGIGDETRV